MDAASVSIMQDPRFKLDDFLSRWRKARIAALQSLVSGSAPECSDEEELLVCVKKEDSEQVLRRVFDLSRKFGLSASRYLGLTFEISDIAEILAESKIPCIGGAWKKHNSARVRERTGCASLKVLGSLGCDYWREALDGLVMGVGENERLTRHRSAGHGDSECVDVLFREEFTIPRVVSAGEGVKPEVSPKFGEISEEVSAKMDPVVSRFRKMKIQLVLAGISEGTLYYRLDPEKGVLCGAAGKLMHDTFVRDTQKLYPNLKVKDIAPLAVYGGST